MVFKELRRTMKLALLCIVILAQFPGELANNGTDSPSSPLMTSILNQESTVLPSSNKVSTSPPPPSSSSPPPPPSTATPAPSSTTPPTTTPSPSKTTTTPALQATKTASSPSLTKTASSSTTSTPKVKSTPTVTMTTHVTSSNPSLYSNSNTMVTSVTWSNHSTFSASHSIKPSTTTYTKMSTVAPTVVPSWSNWTTEKNCREKCCGIGGQVTLYRSCLRGSSTLTSSHAAYCNGSSSTEVKCAVGCPECSPGGSMKLTASVLVGSVLLGLLLVLV